MKQYQVESINNYDGLVTFLDFNAPTHQLLQQKRFAPKNKKILVDMGLIVVRKGWRFIEYTLDENGYVESSNARYINYYDLDSQTQSIINNVINEHRDLVESSEFINERNKKELLFA